MKYLDAVNGKGGCCLVGDLRTCAFPTDSISCLEGLCSSGPRECISGWLLGDRGCNGGTGFSWLWLCSWGWQLSLSGTQTRALLRPPVC